MAKIKIKFNGTIYSIDDNKLSDAYSKLSLTFAELAKAEISEGLDYTLNDDGTSYSVSGIGTCTDTEVVIASEYEGLPVTTIGIGAFYDCSSLTSIEIPNSITSIDSNAFSGCSNLTSIEIPNSVISIDSYAFAYCSNLTSIVIPNSVKSIGDSAFEHCSALTSIVIPNGVTSIGYRAFSGCSNLTSIVIPNSVASIDSKAFYGCSNLTDITYTGTTAQWNTITKDTDWNLNVPATHVHCTDGQVVL